MRARKFGMTMLVGVLLAGSALPISLASASGRTSGMKPATASVDGVQPSVATTVAPVARVTPRMINTRSHGKWVKVRLDFGAGADAALVDTNTLVIFVAGQTATLTPSGVAVTSDSTSTLLMNVSRADFAALLSNGSNVVTISGAWLDGTAFTASDTIRAKTPGGGKGHGKGHGKSNGKGKGKGHGKGHSK